jgi:hypothetical protein
MHLLVETALGDCQEYEVLSFEEIDELKKEYSLLSNRVDATKRKLALESKVRDAALSLNRLYAAKTKDSGDGSPKKHRRSLLGSRGSATDMTSRTDEELTASTRKCEELAQELWRLEKRATELNRRILSHNAGILQMTYRSSKQKPSTQLPMPQSGIPPGSPESMFTFFNNRGSLNAAEEDEFDDRSFYQAFDKLDDSGDGFGRDSPGSNGRGASRSPGHLSQTT